MKGTAGFAIKFNSSKYYFFSGKIGSSMTLWTGKTPFVEQQIIVKLFNRLANWLERYLYNFTHNVAPKRILQYLMMPYYGYMGILTQSSIEYPFTVPVSSVPITSEFKYTNCICG